MSNLIDSLQVFNVVSVVFRNSSSKTYSYKTTGTHAVGDEVLVHHDKYGSTVVDVVAFTSYNSLNRIEGVEYKWIVGPVDLTEYHHQLAVEEKVQQILHKALDIGAAKQARNALLASIPKSKQTEVLNALSDIGVSCD